MRFEESLLGGVEKSAVEGRAAGHAAHRKHLQFGPLAREIRIGFLPIHLRFHAPRVALRNESIVNHQAHRNLPVVNILPNGSFADSAVRDLPPDALPDPWAVYRCFRGAFLSVSKIWFTNSIAIASFQRGRCTFFRSIGTALPKSGMRYSDENAAAEDWNVLTGSIPGRLEAGSDTNGGGRKAARFSSPDMLLRTLLLHAGNGFSLARALQAKLRIGPMSQMCR